MLRRTRLLMLIVSSVGLMTVESMAGDPEPELSRLKDHVETLASPAFGGRREQGAVRARTYLIEEFRKLGLEPLFNNSFTQDVKGPGDAEVIGVNVGAKIKGTDPALEDHWVILGAHYDHLGQVGERFFPGADDNASGVSMMLETARSIAGSAVKPRRSIAFVGFDLEERGPKGEFGLRGSQYFTRHPPIPLTRISLFVTADMIGRSLGGVCEKTVFVLGSEHEPEVRPWIARGTQGKPIEVALLGSDMLVIDRSDYGPFRSRKIPYLFFTTGENPAYHSTRDVPETIDFPKLESISRLIHSVVRQALDDPTEVAWSAVPDYPLAEATAIRSVLKTLLLNRDRLKVGPYQVTLMEQTLRTIDEIVGRGSMTLVERGQIARAAQIILFTVF